MKKSILFLFFGVIFTTLSMAQSKDVSLKIGSCYFINCKRTIAFGDYSVMTVTGDDKTGRKVNFDIYAPNGKLDVSLKNGVFSGVNKKYYAINQITNGFSIVDSRNNRIVLKIVSVENKREKRYDMHVWADFYLPNGGRFQCTPDECNVPFMQMMKGATFANALTAIQLN